MAKKIGPYAVVVDRSGEPVTLLPGEDVPDWATEQLGDHVYETEATDVDETAGGQPLADKGTRIDGAEPEAGVPAPEDTPDPDLRGASGDGGDGDGAPDFTKPAASKRASKK